jgi:LPS sulfotransferase NodH
LARFGSRYFQKSRVERHLKHFYTTAGARSPAVGFKVMTSQLRQYETLLPTLVSLAARRFFLYRQDSFATALSYFKARASGVFHSDRAAGITPRKEVHADIHEFRAIMARCELDRQAIIDLHASCGGLLLKYEDLVDNWDYVVSRIGCDLDIVDLRVPAVLDRLSSASNAVLVDNESELRRHFANKQS